MPNRGEWSEAQEPVSVTLQMAVTGPSLGDEIAATWEPGTLARGGLVALASAG